MDDSDVAFKRWGGSQNKNALLEYVFNKYDYV